MVNEEKLSQLKDIHLPDPIGWWPLAPAWYVLFALIMVLIFVSSYIFKKRQHDAIAKNQALDLLKQYVHAYEKEKQTAQTCAKISELLKRVALAYYPRNQVASLYGEAWLEFLNKTGKNVDFNSVKSLVLLSPFKSKETVDLHPLFHQAQLWITQRRAPCLN